jgi:hypothetical protein
MVSLVTEVADLVELKYVESLKLQAFHTQVHLL